MSCESTIVPDKPNWEPLERFLAREECELFMYMGRHGGIELYKHYDTRRYLNIAATSDHFYQYLDGKYVEISQDAALAYVRG